MVVQQGQHGSVQHSLAHFCSVNVVFSHFYMRRWHMYMGVCALCDTLFCVTYNYFLVYTNP